MNQRLQAYLLHGMTLNDFRVTIHNMRNHEEEVTDNSPVSPPLNSQKQKDPQNTQTLKPGVKQADLPESSTRKVVDARKCSINKRP